VASSFDLNSLPIADNRRIIVKPGSEYQQFIKTIDKYIHEKD
jgi:hypothetical protein